MTVERKSGTFAMPAGRSVTIPRLAGHLFVSRSPDERITRDVVLGGLQDETVPDCIVCAADATNLRLSRACPGWKRVGRLMLLVLNMMDLARHRGIAIDLDRLSSNRHSRHDGGFGPQAAPPTF